MQHARATYTRIRIYTHVGASRYMCRSPLRDRKRGRNDCSSIRSRAGARNTQQLEYLAAIRNACTYTGLQSYCDTLATTAKVLDRIRTPIVTFFLHTMMRGSWSRVDEAAALSYIGSAERLITLPLQFTDSYERSVHDPSCRCLLYVGSRLLPGFSFHRLVYLTRNRYGFDFWNKVPYFQFDEIVVQQRKNCSLTYYKRVFCDFLHYIALYLTNRNMQTFFSFSTHFTWNTLLFQLALCNHIIAVMLLSTKVSFGNILSQ